MTHWFRVHGHERGASALVPDFVDDDGLVFPTDATRPRGARAEAPPWFSIVDERVFPTRHHPAGETAEPWFEVVRSFVYPAEGHPGGRRSAPWYQVRRPIP